MDDGGHLNLTESLVEVETSLDVSTAEEADQLPSSLQLDGTSYVNETIHIMNRKQSLLDGAVEEVLDSGILETLPNDTETNVLINSGQVICDNHFKNQVWYLVLLH